MVQKLTIKPTLEEVRELSKRGNLIPVYAELPTDLDTPVSLFLKLSGTEPCFLLESVEGGERIARYSFLGVRMKEAFVLRGDQLSRHTLTADGLRIEPIAIPQPKLDPLEGPRKGDVLDALRQEMERYQFVPVPGLPRFCGGLVGYTGYDVVRQFEHLPDTAKDVLGVPEAVYMLSDTLCVFDHAKHRLLVIANVFVEGDDGRRGSEAVTTDDTNPIVSESDHHQVVADYAQPLGETNSIFMSFSAPNDLKRAPAGHRAVTISTHTNLAEWWRLRDTVGAQAAYDERKALYAERMLDNAETVFPDLRSRIRLQLEGTPVTFKFYTRRHKGGVGGFPFTSLFQARGPWTGLRNAWLVGDSIFPGQSTAGVTMGAMRVADEVLRAF